MLSTTRLPLGASSFAVIAGVVLAANGVSLILTLGVILLWLGSLWLATAEAPDAVVGPVAAPLDEAQMGELFEMSETPVIVTTRDRVTVANASARELLGGHILGQDVRVALRHPRAVALIDSADSEGATISGLVRRRDVWRINRKLLPGKVAVFELLNRTAEADISRAHTDFVANASHELRTPLASIIGYVETLIDGEASLDTETRGRFHGTIQREGKRLQSLVEDLMSLSRIEAEKHEAPAQALALAPLAERASRDAAGSERLERLALTLEDDIEVRGDSQQLEQLVRNLVDNALKYGGADTNVEVALTRDGEGWARLSVTDHGEGIASQHLPHLTRRFYRTDPGRSRASGGTGLGLAIVKHIVERHRGKLDIASTRGVGTTVSVRFPTAK